jgi:hypothetical protein
VAAVPSARRWWWRAERSKLVSSEHGPAPGPCVIESSPPDVFEAEARERKTVDGTVGMSRVEMHRVEGCRVEGCRVEGCRVEV